MKTQQFKQVFKQLKTSKLTLDEISDTTKIPKSDVKNLIHQIKGEGFDVVKREEQYFLKTLPPNNTWFLSGPRDKKE